MAPAGAARGQGLLWVPLTFLPGGNLHTHSPQCAQHTLTFNYLNHLRQTEKIKASNHGVYLPGRWVKVRTRGGGSSEIWWLKLGNLPDRKWKTLHFLYWPPANILSHKHRPDHVISQELLGQSSPMKERLGRANKRHSCSRSKARPLERSGPPLSSFNSRHLMANPYLKRKIYVAILKS